MKSSASAFLGRSSSLPVFSSDHNTTLSLPKCNAGKRTMNVPQNSYTERDGSSVGRHSALPLVHTTSQQSNSYDTSQRHCLRPVTIRLLVTSLLSNFAAITAPVMLSSVRDTDMNRCLASRAGQDTMLVDGALCCGVTLCGRVLYRSGADEGGSIFTTKPYSLLLISDHTGMIGIVHYHTVMHESEEAENVHEETVSAGRHNALSACEGESLFTDHRNECGGGVDGGREDDEESASSGAAAFVSQHAYQGSTHTNAFSSALQSGGGTHHRRSTCVPVEELDIQVGDYVVCSGRLCFCDVDKDVMRFFRHVSLPRSLGQRGVSCVAASGVMPDGRSGDSSCHHLHQQESLLLSASSVSASYAAPPISSPCCRLEDFFMDNVESEVFVILPGAAEELSRDALAALGIVGDLPPGSQIFTTREEAAAAAAVATKGDSSCKSTSDLQQYCAPQSVEDSTAHGCSDTSSTQVLEVPVAMMPFCVKGDVRVVESSNEIAFWTLTALHTHLRFRSQEAT